MIRFTRKPWENIREKGEILDVLRDMLLLMLGFSPVITRVCAIDVNTRKEDDIEDDDGCFGSCYSNRVSTIVNEMESGANVWHGFGALFFWEGR